MQTILLVDDDPAIRTAWSRVLRLKHYGVATASVGQAGLLAANDVKPALIISDREMPGMGGIEFCRHMKGDPRFAGIPVVLVSAADVSALHAPVWDDFWQKPVSPEAILASIRRLLASPREWSLSES